jgi:zinc protease
VPYAIGIMVKELQGMAAASVLEDELQTAKRAFIDTFPRRFATKGQVASVFAEDEFTGRYARQPDYWKTYRSRVETVTAAEVQHAARQHLRPDRLAILIVGAKDEILKGHPDHPEKLADFGGGKFTEVPLRDPMTLQPLR